MQKFLIGCGIVFLLVVLVCGFFAWKFVKMGIAFVEDLKVAAERVEAIDHKFPFTPQEGQLIEAARFDQWIDVHRSFDTHLQSFIATMEGMEEEGKVFGAIEEVMAQTVNLVTGMADILEISGMSFNEFEWIEGQVVAAIESEAIEKHETLVEALNAYKEALAKTAEARRKMKSGALTVRPSDAQIAHTIGLIEQHKDAFLEIVESLASPIASVVEGIRSGAADMQPTREPQPAGTNDPEAAPAY